jgi:uracil-DNA glycosylase
MLVGQAPGKEEVRRGMPFVGPAGRRLFEWLKRSGFEEREFRLRCYITAVYKCYPGSAGHGDLRPSRSQLERCSHFVDGELAVVRPEVLIPVGGLAIEHFLGKRQLADVVGRQFKRTLVGLTVTVIPLPHPSGASVWPFKPGNQQLLARALDLIVRASSRSGRGNA